MRRTAAFILLGLGLIGHHSAGAQGTGRAPGASVTGFVFDSLARAPLVGATVQLVADGPDLVGKFAISDSLGRYTIDSVPAGRYLVGFVHPTLDVLGLVIPPRQLNIAAGSASARLDLGLPSPGTLKLAVCGGRASDSTALVLGDVRDDKAAMAGATVVAEWIEFALTKQGMARHVSRASATTSADGHFALCGVPRVGTVTLSAKRGNDSTGRLDVEVPAGGFLRRELIVGAERTVLRGTVVRRDGGAPIANAQVAIANGPQTRANERGEWSIADAPTGTRMIEVRSVGFLAERSAVDVLPDAPPVRTELASVKTLDTVRVNARSVVALRMAEFEERRTRGTGRYLTAADVARRQPIVTSDLFRNISGLYLERSRSAEGFTESVLRMRGTYVDRCAPGIYIDQRYLGPISADDIDDWVHPNEIAGIEVYASTEVPPQFSTGMAGVGSPSGDGPVPMCGSIVIWTKLNGNGSP